jgi:carboxypeptidase family protein/TonB-dependent receptor-like protein
MSSIELGARASFSGLGGKITLLFLAILGVLLASVSVFSQGSNGRILGTVTDQSGGVISNATVTITDKDRGLARTLTTDVAGEFNAPQLLPGTYTVAAEANGFKKLERQNVELGVGKEVRVDLTLQPGAQAQTVTVTEALPLVETTNATLGGTLQNAAINDLPLNGRNFQSLMGLRPGVMLQPGGSPWTQSTNNVRPDETSWLVDGILNANAFDARPVAGASSPFTDGATILPVDAIQEFNLEENPKAEYGGKPGAVVNVGIRSGTNNLHGTAYAFGRDGSWDARNLFNPPPQATLPLELEQFGAAVGGPIKKDKLFFFANYEGLRDTLANAIGSSVPATGAGLGPDSSMVDAINGVATSGGGFNTALLSPVSLKLLGCTVGATAAATACTGGYIINAPSNTTTYVSNFPNTNRTDNGIAKIDYRINDKHMINGMFYKANYLALGEDFAMVNPIWENDVPEISWTASGNWVWTATSRLVNEFRVGYNRFTFEFLPHDRTSLADGTTYPLNTGITSTGGFPSINITGFNAQLGSRRGRPLEASPNPYHDFQDNVSYLMGKHSFKFGGEFSHIEGDSNPHDTRGRIIFNGGQTLGGSSTALEDFFAGDPFRAFLLTGNPAIKATSNVYGVFGQDDWRVTSKLIVNLGLRWEYRTPYHEANNLLGGFDPKLGLVQQGQASVGDTMWKPDRKNFSPRLGFAYDVTGKGTTVVRGGLGIFYSMFTLAPFTGNPGIQNVGGGTSIAAVPTGGCTVPVPAGFTCAQQGGTTLSSGGTIATGTVRIPGSKLNWNSVVFPTGGGVSCTAASACSIGSVDPNLLTPTVFDWNLGVQHAFTPNLSLDVSYVGTRGEHLIGVVDLNQIDPNTGVGPYSAAFPYLQFINWTTNDADSHYNSLQATLTQRLNHGVSFTFGYTYGHGIDNGSLNRFAPQPENSFSPGAERADSDFDIRHRATITASYEIPGKKGFGQMLEGWKLNTIVTLSGAQPWNVMDTNNNFSNTNESTDRWDFFGNPSDFKATSSSIPYCNGFNPANINDLSGVTCTSNSGVSGIVTTLPSSLGAKCAAVTPDINTLAGNNALQIPAGGCYVVGNSVMVPPKFGTFGTMGRNMFRDAGFKNVDLSIFKNFKFTERFSAQFRAEFFNLFNHPIIANPWGSVNGYQGGSDPSGPSTFGCGCTTPDIAAGNPIVGSGDARTIQLGLKLMF